MFIGHHQPGETGYRFRDQHVTMKNQFLAKVCCAAGCIITLESGASAQVKVYDWGTNWTGGGKISTDQKKEDWETDNNPFPNTVAFGGEIVSASTEGEKGQVRARLDGDGFSPGSRDGEFSGTQPIEIEIRCGVKLAALLGKEIEGRKPESMGANFVFDAKSQQLAAIYLGYAWKSNLTPRGEADEYAHDLPGMLPERIGWYKPRIPKGTYVRAQPWDQKVIAFEFDASAFNNLWLVQNPDGGRRTIPLAQCYLTPSGIAIHLSKGYGNGADPPEVETEPVSALSSEFFGSKAITKSKADLKVLPEVREVDFPNGFQVLDAPNGKVLKEVDGATSAKVRAYKEVGGRTFYISDWSYDRISEGKEPNYILSR